MTMFGKMVVSCFVVFSISVMHVQAKKIEIVLHDYQIKQRLAEQGINLDDAWKDVFDASGSIEEENLSRLCGQIEQVFNVAIDTKELEIDFPTSAQDFGVIFESLGFIEPTEHNENENNLKVFNELLSQDKPVEYRAMHNETFDLRDLQNTLASMINSYLTKEAIQARLGASKEKTLQKIHIYIKFVIDTDTQTITPYTAPNEAQDSFEKAYTHKDMQNWLPKVNGLQFCKAAQVMNKKREIAKKKSGSSCLCSLPSLIVASGALAIGGYLSYQENQEFFEQQINDLVEQFGNFTS